MSDGSIYRFEVETLTGEETTLAPYRGQVLLIVNTASQCVFTSQYKGLEELQERYVSSGFNVLGFPCNQFGAQEPGSASEIQTFCTVTYGVRFPLFSKIDVNGPHAHPLYRYLTSTRPGLFGSRNIKWNFTKFLVNRVGDVVDRFAPRTNPAKLASAIERLLDSR